MVLTPIHTAYRNVLKLRKYLFGTHLVRIFGAKILKFLLFLLKTAMISWFPALFGYSTCVEKVRILAERQ